MAARVIQMAKSNNTAPAVNNNIKYITAIFNNNFKTITIVVDIELQQ